MYDRVANLFCETSNPSPNRSRVNPIPVTMRLPEMSLYRAYFVPEGVDPSGLQLQETLPVRVPTTPTEFPRIYRPPAGSPGVSPTGRPGLKPWGPLVFLDIIFTPTEMGDSEYHPPRFPRPFPEPEKEPEPYGPKCPNDCQKKWGYELCPPNPKTPWDVSEDFIDSEGMNSPYRQFGIQRCFKVKSIPKSDPACASGGEIHHCKLWVADLFGVRETNLQVSVYVCNCCWDKWPGGYTNPVGTPGGKGKPHWGSGGSDPHDPTTW